MQLLHDHALHRHARRDPTKTTMVRARFERDLVRRFRWLKEKIKEAVVKENGFGIATNAGKFDFPTSSKKVAEFMKWLRRQQNLGILEVTEGYSMEQAARSAWANVYIRSAYQKGLAQAAGGMRKGGVRVDDRWVDAGFYRPIHADAIGLAYTRTFSDLNGITTAMDTRISRSLAQAISEGRGMEATAQAILDEVDSIGIVRARALARTEVIRAHAEATLNTYEEAGLEGVELQSEFTTADDTEVCPECEDLEGEVYTIDEARGVIPVHPNCRCAWSPVVTDPNGIELR